MQNNTTPTETTAPTKFPTFYEWITADEGRKLDYEYEAVNALDSFGMTGDASRIIRDHADSAASDFSNNVNAEDINGSAAEDFMEDYTFETYDGTERAALIHWAWNSDMDLTEFGPLEGNDIWQTIEHITWNQINSAARQALAEYADEYADAREEWTARQPCRWDYFFEGDGLHWWLCDTHGDQASGDADTAPTGPCDSAETDEEADK